MTRTDRILMGGIWIGTCVLCAGILTVGALVYQDRALAQQHQIYELEAELDAARCAYERLHDEVMMPLEVLNPPIEITEASLQK